MRHHVSVLGFALCVSSLAACSDAPDEAAAQGATGLAPVGAPRERSAESEVPRKPAEPYVLPVPPAPERGLALYAKHCSDCHGTAGLGDGPAAAHLHPHPWSFQGSVYKWGSTLSGSVSDDDLLRTLRRGIPGTPMPSHADLPEQDLKDLVAAVRHLAFVSTAQSVHEADPDMTGPEVADYVRTLVDGGAVFDIPERPAGLARFVPTAETPTPKAYDRACKECHGADGTGRDVEETDQRDAMGFPNPPRDFTAEVFRGGNDERAVVTRMLRGIPGTGMAGAEVAPSNPEFWEVVDYVRDLNARVDSSGAVQHRATIGALRVPSLPASPSDAAWESTDAVRLPLMPQRIDPTLPPKADVRALHDGVRLALRVEWRGRGDSVAGAAVRLLADAEPGIVRSLDAPGAVARWMSGTPATSAATPPAFVPMSELPADRVSGSGAGERTGDGWAVVLTLDVPKAARLDALLELWDGADADGKVLAGTSIRHTVELR